MLPKDPDIISSPCFVSGKLGCSWMLEHFLFSTVATWCLIRKGWNLSGILCCRWINPHHFIHRSDLVGAISAGVQGEAQSPRKKDYCTDPVLENVQAWTSGIALSTRRKFQCVHLGNSNAMRVEGKYKWLRITISVQSLPQQPLAPMQIKKHPGSCSALPHTKQPFAQVVSEIPHGRGKGSPCASWNHHRPHWLLSLANCQLHKSPLAGAPSRALSCVSSSDAPHTLIPRLWHRWNAARKLAVVMLHSTERSLYVHHILFQYLQLKLGLLCTTLPKGDQMQMGV